MLANPMSLWVRVWILGWNALGPSHSFLGLMSTSLEWLATPLHVLEIPGLGLGASQGKECIELPVGSVSAAMGPQERSFSSLSLSFPSCKMSLIIPTPLRAAACIAEGQVHIVWFMLPHGSYLCPSSIMSLCRLVLGIHLPPGA